MAENKYQNSKTQTANLRRTAGFTIFEFLIVIGLLTIMIGIALVSLNAVRQKSRDNERLALISEVSLSLHDYYLQCGSYPDSLDPQDQSSDPGPCPLKSNDPIEYVLPQSITDATFDPGSKVFHLPHYQAADFFYVPLRSEGINAVDTCDTYHLGAVLETKHRSLLQDDDLNSDAPTPTYHGNHYEICNNAGGYDGEDNNGVDSQVYDIVR